VKCIAAGARIVHPPEPEQLGRVLCFASEGLLGKRKLWQDPLRALYLVAAVIFREIRFSSRTVSSTTRRSSPCQISLPLSALRWRFRVAALRSACGIGSAP